MVMLKDGSKPLHIVIAGANGGIGGALVKYCQQRSDVAQIYALSRQVVSGDKVIHLPLDYDNPDRLDDIAKSIPELDILIIATGALTHRESGPEKRISDVSIPELSGLYQVNAMGPIMLARALAPLFPKHTPSVCLAISARVGSISDNHLGGWYAYRASKAGLNMLFRSLAIELKRTTECCVSLYHPGTVSSPGFAPYQTHTDPSHIKSPETAASELWQHMMNLSQDHSGKLMDYQGKDITF